MKRATIEFMIGWLDALRRDDVEALKATLAPEVVWQGLREEWACHGPDAVIETFAGELEAKEEIGALELIGADDRVILHASGGDIVAIEDVALPEGIYNVFTLDAGTITRIDDYADRHAALSAAGLSERSAGPEAAGG
jgi:ketosteroid isomerase-like protein